MQEQGQDRKHCLAVGLSGITLARASPQLANTLQDNFYRYTSATPQAWLLDQVLNCPSWQSPSSDRSLHVLPIPLSLPLSLCDIVNPENRDRVLLCPSLSPCLSFSLPLSFSLRSRHPTYRFLSALIFRQSYLSLSRLWLCATPL